MSEVSKRPTECPDCGAGLSPCVIGGFGPYGQNTVYCGFSVHEKWPQTRHTIEGLVCKKCGRIVALYAKLIGAGVAQKNENLT
jgi:hypothetical protein